MKIYPKKGGFTLIEILVVMAIFGVIFASLYSGYSLGMHVWRAFCKGGVAADRHLWLGLEKIAKDVKSIFICDTIKFEGEDDSISFPSVQGHEIMQVEYFYKKGKKTLYLTKTKYADLLEEKESKEKREVFKAENLEFSYLYFDPDKNTFYWSSDWLLEDELPKAMRLEFESNGKEIKKLIFIPAA